MIVALDFDETLIEKIEYPNRKYKLKEDAYKVINKMHNIYKIDFVLNTQRYGWYFWSAVHFIKKNKLPIKIKLTPYKIKADIYIDDKNLGCKKIDWLEIEEIILKEVNKSCVTK